MISLKQATSAALFALAAVVTIDASAAAIRVTCDVRATRSRISVDGKGLPAGAYTTQAISGGNAAGAGPVQTRKGQIETDYDSNPADIADGATAIAPSFIQGAQVTGKVIDASGNTVLSDTVLCRVKGL
jgi:hypothetical protein